MPYRVKSAESDLSAVFAKIYEDNAKTIYYYALRILGDPAAAEDATHDVFLKAWKHFHEFRNESNPRTWLYRIAINHCRNILKSHYHKNFSTAEDNRELEDMAIQTDTPLKVIENQELGDAIQKTLDRLPHDYKEILLLAADEQLSYQEIADLINTSTDAVRGRLHRARRLFIRYFQKNK
jgi:RNA polymerase sigma-70 factor (ECF subfamily)